MGGEIKTHVNLNEGMMFIVRDPQGHIKEHKVVSDKEEVDIKRGTRKSSRVSLLATNSATTYLGSVPASAPNKGVRTAWSESS
jgi:hypothetical protein